MTGLLWLALFVITIVCYLLERKLWNDTDTTAFIVVGWIAAVVLAVMLLVWPMVWYGNKELKASYETTVETIEASREVGNTILERAALTHKIIEVNQKLAVKKYWNDGFWDWYIPDDVANLEPIR